MFEIVINSRQLPMLDEKIMYEKASGFTIDIALPEPRDLSGRRAMILEGGCGHNKVETTESSTIGIDKSRKSILVSSVGSQ
jgi:hypothetical protein